MSEHREVEQEEWVMRKAKSDRRSQSRAKGKPGQRANRRRPKAIGLSGLGDGLESLKIGDLYRPLKKPVTLRLDADVLAWFKKDGRRYQTRINNALRKVMEREMR